ncbi:MAG: anti-sigma factor family protein [Limisphaerales bacterium]
MKIETALRLQALLDGELSESEVREVQSCVDREPEVRALLGELRRVRDAMVEGEVTRSLPESREFFWSKVERSIVATANSPGAPVRRAGWLRWAALVIPALATVALALFLVMPSLHAPGPKAASRTDIESPCEDLSSFSFRSEAEGMNVVWISLN